MSASADFANKAIGQLDELLEEFKRLREQSKYDDLSDFGHESQVLASRFQAALGRLAIPNSSYWQEAESLRGSSPHVRVLGLNAIAEALRTDIDKGWTEHLAELVRAETLADLIEMATELLSKGYKDAAAVIGGTALEVHVRALADKTGIAAQLPSGKYKKAEFLNAELKKAGVYQALQQKEVTAWLDLRNSAAHGQYTDNEAVDVKRLIHDVGRFIDKYPA